MKSPNVVLEEYTARDERRLLSIQARRCLDRVCGTGGAATSSLGRMAYHPVSRCDQRACLVLGNTNSPLNGGTHCCHTADRLSGRRLRLRRRPAAITVRGADSPAAVLQTSSQMTAGMVGGCGQLRQRARAGPCGAYRSGFTPDRCGQLEMDGKRQLHRRCPRRARRAAR